MHDVRQWNVGLKCKLDVHQVRRRDLFERERGLMRLVRCWQVVTLRGEHVHQLRRGRVLGRRSVGVRELPRGHVLCLRRVRM